MFHRPELFQDGYLLTEFALPESVRELVMNEQWQAVDEVFKALVAPGAPLFEFVSQFHDFHQIETMLSVRDAKDEWQEDGIWHDDGTRVISFSLSLTLEPVGGGALGIRKVGSEHSIAIPTPAYGQMIVFLTGVHGFEHKIHQVTQGRRVVLVGWCS